MITVATPQRDGYRSAQGVHDLDLLRRGELREASVSLKPPYDPSGEGIRA